MTKLKRDPSFVRTRDLPTGEAHHTFPGLDFQQNPDAAKNRMPPDLADNDKL